MNNVEMVKNVYEAFGKGDIPAVLDAFHPEIHWHEAEGNPYMPTGDPFVGPEEVLNKLFVRLGEEWDGFSVHPHTYYDAGDTVVVECRYTGTYKETGKDMDTQVCHIWKVEDGKLKNFQQYVNTAEMQEVMGVAAVS